MRVTRSTRDAHAILETVMRFQHRLKAFREGMEAQGAEGHHELEVLLGPAFPAVRTRAADEVHLRHVVCGACGITWFAGMSTTSAPWSTPSAIWIIDSASRMAPIRVFNVPCAFSISLR